MEIKRSGSQPSGKGPADYFTGAVRIDPLGPILGLLCGCSGGAGAGRGIETISRPRKVVPTHKSICYGPSPGTPDPVAG